MGRMQHTKVLALAFLINTLLTIVEYGAGALSGSASLLADGSQNLTDSLVIIISFICERVAARPLTTKRRIAEIYRFAASINAGILMLLAIAIGTLAFYRVMHPHALNSSIVITTGILSVVINWWAASLFFATRRDATVAAPYIGLLFSGLSGVGVLASGLASRMWGLQQVDGLVGIAIAALLFARSGRMLINALWRPKALLKKINRLYGWARLP